MKYIDALRKYNEGKDKWCSPRKGSEDYLNIIKMVNKISKIKKTKGVKDNKSNNERMKKNADKKIKILQAAIKRKLAINKRKSSNIISNIKSSISKMSKKPSYNSNSRIFSDDILKNIKVKKIQGFLRAKFVANKHTLTNRINRFNLLTQRLALLKDNDCLEKKTFNNANGFTIKNIINLEKKIGTKSKFGAIYLTNIPNFIENKYPIATKVMKHNNDNINEVNIMWMITNRILLNKVSRHFLMIYGSCACTKRIAEKLKLISINELADGDLKMLVKIRDVIANNELLLNIFFQTFISIASFHNLAGFVHKDAHYGNFLYQINNERGYYHYICDGKDYYLKSCKYNIIIFDYGFSRKINENMNNNLIVMSESKYIFADYTRILNAFMNKKKGWGSYDDLPSDRINDIIINIHNILNNNIYYELTSNVRNNIPYSKRIINFIIKNIFLKLTPKDMFITMRPPNVINEIPFRID